MNPFAHGAPRHQAGRFKHEYKGVWTDAELQRFLHDCGRARRHPFRFPLFLKK